MAYISLYRKYRPQTFADVVGQEHVTRTLRNAITEGRVASGYLFCGTRGTAKTTCARILAKALNCIGPDGLRTDPNPEPCGVCGPCVSIANSSFVDVLEQDAASHGKVDDVRDITGSIKFPPMEGRYKVYIIDEAHQLSRDAMDAFLKTLEEPPDRVVFILATTEQDKLPITISSRCQVFEFKRGSVAQISSRLSEVLQAEGVAAQPGAITLVARAADGSYRDSLSLLEQVLAYKRQNLTAQDVDVVLGAVGEDVLNRVVELIANSDAAGAFALAGEVLESGRDVRQFLKSLSARVRDLLFVGVGAQPVEAGDLDDSPALRAQAAKFSPAQLMHALEVLTDAEQETRRNNQHRLLLEMTLLRLMRLPQALSPASEVKFAAIAPVPFPVPGEAAPVPPAAPAPAKAVPPSVPAPAKAVPPSVPAEPVPAPRPVAAKAEVAPPPAFAEAAPVPPARAADAAPAASPAFAEAEAAPPALRNGTAKSAPTPEPTAPIDDMPLLLLPDEEPARTLSLIGDIPPLLSDEEESDLADDDDDVDDMAVPLPGDDDLDILMPEADALPSMMVTSADQHAETEDFMQVQQVARETPTAPAAPSLPPPSEDADTPPELLQLQKSWQEVINRMGSRAPSGVALVRDAKPTALHGHTFTLEFTSQFFVDRLAKNEKGRITIEDVINKTLDAAPETYKIKCIMQGEGGPANGAAKKVGMPSSAPRPAPTEADSALLDEVIAVFGGRVLDDTDAKG